MNHKKIVLAYSGGLDTSYCILFLKDQGYSVHAVHINTGGFNQKEVLELKSKAEQFGADNFESINNESEYYRNCVRYLIYGNVLRNDTYPLSVSSERVFQAMSVLEYANSNEIKYVAHGSTGAGNDQVRFDAVFETLSPDIRIITPIRDQSLSRSEEVQFIRSKGFEWNDDQKEYSINQGLWGTSIGGKETLTSRHALPDEAYLHHQHEKKGRTLKIQFEKGEPVAIDDKFYESKVELIKQLNVVGNLYAIGRDIHVGDTIIGIKGRVGFEAPAALMIIKSHHLLEKHCLSKWQAHWKKQLADWYGMFLHEGKYFEPVMRNIEDFLENTQQTVSGTVFLQLLPYRFVLEGIESDKDLMNSSFGQYGEQNLGWSGDDVKGFTKIFSNADKIYYSINPKPTLK